MKRSITPVLLMVALAAVLTACTNSSRIIAAGLETKLTKIVRAADGTVTADWHVNNPNIVSYLFSRVSAKVYLNGTYVGVIVDEKPLGVPANTEVERSGKISGSDAAAARVLTEAIARGSASYRVDTQITILVYDDNIEKSNLSNTGTVPVSAQ